MSAGVIVGAVSMGEKYGYADHPPLRSPRWWACEHPERPWEDDVTQVMFTCVCCFPLWELAYLDGVVFINFDTGKLHRPPEEHGDRFHWFMDVDRWCR